MGSNPTSSAAEIIGGGVPLEELEANERLGVFIARKERGGLTNHELVPFINEAFALLEGHPSDIEKTRVAIILSGVVYEGLADRVRQFLKDHPKFPARGEQVLSANLMRVASY